MERSFSKFVGWRDVFTLVSVSTHSDGDTLMVGAIESKDSIVSNDDGSISYPVSSLRGASNPRVHARYGHIYAVIDETDAPSAAGQQ